MFQDEPYHLLPSNDGTNHTFSGNPTRVRTAWRTTLTAFCHILLGVSLLLNVYLLISIREDSKIPPSPYSGTRRDVSVPLTHETEWWNNSSPSSASDALWDTINFDAGVVAIPLGEAAAMGLPPTQKFPWDYQKGVYLLNGYHNLHCAKMVRKFLEILRDGGSLSHEKFGHAFHCIDAFRKDFLCQADDTPHVTGIMSQKESSPVYYPQSRQCRDWNKVESWAKQYNACFKYIELDEHDSDEHARFTFCPEGSPYKETIERFYASRERKKNNKINL